MAGTDWRESAARIDTLLAAAGDTGEELVRTVADLYGAGLERMLDLLYERGALTDAALEALAGDDLVAGLLLVHGLHPHDTATRVALAIKGTGVELIEITEDGLCRLRGRRPHGLEQLIEAAAPEITGVSVEAPTPLIPVSALFTRPAS
ncbi:hypothetical protein [Actinoplanes subtropicus]|uniref:hypothetical protein n=1 Tax=Actinoplanes subtropicus TaxID=543632 RepID=UPI00069146CF|nr:hypothetical protein [Actinoplanes subtropicus]